MPNAWLVDPEFPPTYGGKFTLDFVGKKPKIPPMQ
jgi:hypothetical protein